MFQITMEKIVMKWNDPIESGKWEVSKKEEI